MTILKTVTSKTTDKRKYKDGHKSRKYLYLRKCDRYRRNSNNFSITASSKKMSVDFNRERQPEVAPETGNTSKTD